MNDFAGAEFEALRATVRERGTARMWMFLVGLVGWGIVLLAVIVWLPNPLASMIPLTILVATFETVRMLHLGVERIGRYLQVFYEEGRPEHAGVAPTKGVARTESGTFLPRATSESPESRGVRPAWETMAMALGPQMPGAGAHPLFLPIFFFATIANTFAILMPGPVAIELRVLLVPHVAFLVWILYADYRMRGQRARELARFRELREDTRGLR